MNLLFVCIFYFIFYKLPLRKFVLVPKDNATGNTSACLKTERRVHLLQSWLVLRHPVMWQRTTEVISDTWNKAALSSAFQQVLCVKLSVLWCCLSKKKKSIKCITVSIRIISLDHVCLPAHTTSQVTHTISVSSSQFLVSYSVGQDWRSCKCVSDAVTQRRSL